MLYDLMDFPGVVQTDQLLSLPCAGLSQDVWSAGGGGVQSKCRIHVTFWSVCLLLQKSIQYILCCCSVNNMVFSAPFAGKIPFIHVGNQVVSELGPIVQFTKAKVCLLILLRFYVS